MDDADRAERIAEQDLTGAIERARSVAADMPGPTDCLRCGMVNDRRKAGFGVCWSCLEESA